MPDEYEKLAGEGYPPVECTDTTLRIAMTKLGPSFVYDLWVPAQEFLYFCNEIRKLTCADFAIQINVHAHAAAGRHWWLRANDRAVGSSGY